MKEIGQKIRDRRVELRLLRELNLQYNKSRQQAITNELLDIVGGTVNN